MKVMRKINNSLSISLVALLSISVALVQGCKQPEADQADQKEKKEDDKKKEVEKDKKKSEEKTFTLAKDPIAAFVGKGDKKDYSAIGSNSNGLVYFGTESNHGVIYVYNGSDEAVEQPLKLPNGKNTSPTNANFADTFLTGRNDKAVITKIVAGPGDYAVFAVKGLGGTPLGQEDEGGIGLMNGSDFVAGWRNNKTFFHRNIGQDHRDFKALAVVKDRFFGFMDSATAKVAIADFSERVPISSSDFIIKNVSAAVGDNSLPGIYYADINGAVKRLGATGDAAAEALNKDIYPGEATNKGITSLAKVGDKLLIGFNDWTSLKAKGAKGKGLGEIDLTKDADNFRMIDSEIKVNGIAISSKVAVIAAKEGAYKYVDGKLTPIEGLPEGEVIGVTFAKGNFYLAVKGAGVFTVKVE